MKKFILIGIALLMMSSCVKHPDIYVKLAEEDATAIPYQEGQTVSFLDQNGDTLTYHVTRDVTYPYNEDQYINAINGGDVTHPAHHSIECYARTVNLNLIPDQFYQNRLCFTVRPGKEFTFSFDFGSNGIDLEMYLLSNTSCTTDGVNYENVHHEILYSHYTGELLYDWYYSEEFGLLYFKKGDFSITRIP